jgi:hypothetical protein
MDNKTLTLSTPLVLSAAADGDALPTKFNGVAYSGDYVPGYDIVVDLESTEVPSDMPLLFQHNHGEYIGAVNRAERTAERITVAGELFSDIDATAEDIARKSQRGAKYQMSIGLYGGGYHREKGATVNGRKFDGPVDVLRGAEVREVSIVALGADKNTSATVFALPNNTERTEMPDTTLADLKAQLDAMRGQVQSLTDEREALRTELSAAKTELEAQQKDAREKSVKALFADLGRKYTEEEAAPYIGMSAEAFDAVSATLRSMGAANKGGLYGEVALSGKGGGEGGGEVSLSASVKDRFGL